MRNRAELTGKTFGRWTVDSEAEMRGDKRFWKCTCDCGNTGEVITASLVDLKSRSCGCLKKETSKARGVYQSKRNRKPKGVAGFNVVLKGYKRHSARRGRTFDLSEGVFRELLESDCHYCGGGPRSIARGCSKEASEEAVAHASYTYNGIDRVDNSLGYSVGNCVTCCEICNRMKLALSQKEFYDHIAKIANHRAAV